jgi:hypothetical protein
MKQHDESDEILKQAAATQPGSDCLTSEQLEQLLASGAESQNAASQHVAGCSHCGAELALMREFLTAEPTAAEAADVARIEQQLRRNPAWRRSTSDRPASLWSRVMQFLTTPAGRLALAGVAAMIAIAVWLNPVSRQGPIGPIGSDDPFRSAQIGDVQPTGDLQSPPEIVRWAPIPQAARYQVALTEVDQAVVWTGTVDGASELRIPQQARDRMLEKKTLFWVVTGLNADGKAIARSSPQQFRVVTGNR